MLDGRAKTREGQGPHTINPTLQAKHHLRILLNTAPLPVRASWHGSPCHVALQTRLSTSGTLCTGKGASMGLVRSPEQAGDKLDIGD